MQDIDKTFRRRASICVLSMAMAVCLHLALAGSAHAAFGISGFDGLDTNANGSADTQAGSHPYDYYTSISFNVRTDEQGNQVPDGQVKDIHVDLPVGFVGDPGATPKCTEPQLISGGFIAGCPNNTAVGVVYIRFLNKFFGRFYAPIYNMVPPGNRPAEFAFVAAGVPIHLIVKVRSGSDYGLSVDSDNIPQVVPLEGVDLTFWGVPADPSHDEERGTDVGYPTGGDDSCIDYNKGLAPETYGVRCSNPANLPLTALLSNPTSCTGPVTTTAHADSWEQQGAFAEESFLMHDTATPANTVGFTGCEKLPFSPTIKVTPDTAQADSPAGLTVEVKMPQGGLLNPQGITSADIRNTTVTLPPGVVINPGQAAGLTACQPEQDGVGVEGPPSCPVSSKVGTVEIATPLLPNKLEGDIYVLQSNPPDLKLLVAASGEGVDLKLIGDVHLDEHTGALTTTFENTPQLPFDDLKLAFSGGAQAALATPASCGEYKTTGDFTPSTTPSTPDALATDAFAITSGPGGSACSSPLPFSPSLIAGATTDQAGGFTSFSLLLSRGDGQQRISSLQFKTPEGLLGMIRQVPLCAEAQAAAGSCPSASQVGHTIVQAGPGPYPLTVPQPGQAPAPIYLTGPYNGAPYGLAIVVPVVAGPFNLGTVVVRASIAVDPHTSQLTITTDALPSILDGVPTDIRGVNAVIDRAGFMFNPTSCAPMSFGGTATSTEGAVASISSHFQVGSCQSLKFAPRFVVSTAGRTSRANGASLDAKIDYPTGALGEDQASSQANIAKVRVDLPKQLPSRLTTLQKACTAATFDSNPASCPAASVVGSGQAVTPVLGVPLSGPAYFVSHGGEAFPSLVVVLQGDGVTVDLTGTTFISKAGITSSTFKQVPDVPITSFELKLPQGPHSALAANGNLCTSKLVMPTAFVGQNGAEIHESTKMAATGCTKARKKAKAKKQKQTTKKK
jgi:hypothetical protein